MTVSKKSVSQEDWGHIDPMVPQNTYLKSDFSIRDSFKKKRESRGLGSHRPHGTTAGLNLISTNYPDHGHHGRLSLSRENAHCRAGNRTWDLMVSSQEL